MKPTIHLETSLDRDVALCGVAYQMLHTYFAGSKEHFLKPYGYTKCKECESKLKEAGE